MTTSSEVLDFFQRRYYDAMDGGDGSSATEIFDQDVTFSHMTTSPGEDGVTTVAVRDIEGIADLRSFLEGAAPGVQGRGMRHTVRRAVRDGDVGAMLCDVHIPDTGTTHFLVWFEFRGDRVSRYVMRPVRHTPE